MFKDIALYQRVTVNDTLSVINLGTVHSLTNINGRSVNDGRVSVVNGYMIDPDYTNLTSCREKGSFVYRNYTDPDTTMARPIDLKIDFVNTVKTGNIEIQKTVDFTDILKQDNDFDVQAYIESYNKKPLSEKISFTVEFANIMNRYLERQAPQQKTSTVLYIENGQ